MKVGPIEENIPIHRDCLKYPLFEMKINNSFLLSPESKKESLRSIQCRAVTQIRKIGQQMGCKFVSRIMRKENGVRVWRQE